MRSCWGTAAVLALLAVALPAWAQSSASGAGADDYKSTVTEALKEYELGHWDEAEALFARAHELNPNARTLRGMGLAAFENRRYVLAVGRLRAALEEKRNALTAAQRKEVQGVIDRASAFISHFVVTLSPANAEITVNGAPASRSESGELLLDPGEYEIVATAEGYKTGSARVTAEGGARGRAVIELEPDEAEAETPAPEAAAASAFQPNSEATHSEPQAHGSGARVLMYTGFAVLGAGVIAGSVTGILALTKGSALKDACPHGDCPPAQRSKLDTANTMATVSNVAFGVAAAGAAAAVIGLVLQGSDSGSEDTATASVPSLRPVLGLDRVGVSARF